MLTVVSEARTYYISSSSGNDSNAGTSPSSPWKSLTKLYNSWSSITAGDSILLKRGDTFAPSSVSNRGVIEIPKDKSGNANGYITIGAYGSGSKPVVSNSNVSSFSYGVYAKTLSYFVIRDLKITGGMYFFPGDGDLGAHHVKLLNLELEGSSLLFLNPYQPANTPEPNVGKPLHHIEVGYCVFRNSTGEDAFNIAETQGFNWFHHNQFYNVEEEAIDMGGGDSSIVEYNLVSGTTANGIKLHSQFMKQTNTIVRGNVINLGAGNYSYPLAFEVTQGGKVYNNTFVGVQYAAFLGWLHANPPLISNPKNNSMDMSNNEFYNNIFYGTVIVGIAKGVTYTYRNGSKATITHDEIWDDNYFSNNIFYTPYDTKKIRVFYYSGTITYNASVAPYGRYSSNLSQTELNITESNFATQWEGRANITNDMYANPQFVNGTWNSATNYGDYRLQSSSPALASGRIIPEWKYDMDNKLIPQGIAPDRGAYQKNTSGGVADIIKPELKTAAAKDAQTIILTFSEALDKASAENAGNYTIGGSVQVMQASLSSAGTQATLITSQHEAGMTYTVAANNVKDLAGNVIASQSNFATYTVKQTTVDNSHKLVIQTASGSAAPDLPVHGPEKAIDGKCAQDGDPDSRWAAELMPQHITFDLGSMQTISKTRFSFFKWNEGRIYRYSVQVSADNTNWKEVVAEASSTQEEWTENIFDEQQARYVRLQFIDSNHSTPEWTGYAGLWEAEVWGKTGQTTGTEEKNDMLPKEFSLEQNYPNPFNPSTKISFSLPVASNVKLTIFNSIGEVVRELTNNHFEAGSHQMEFNASGLASGIYLYRIETASFTQTKKMMLMK